MPRARKEASAWLAASGFEVVAVEDVPQALELIGRLRPVIVLADTALRDERGRGLCQAVRQLREGSGVPVLALCSGPREVAAALEAGASDVLEGPFDGRVAARRAEQLVRLSETAGELGRVREENERLRKAAEDERREALWRGRFDALTGLPDGERLERTLENALVGASEKSQVAVALFDIEHLVKLNSRLGRARANSVLQQVAQRLVAVLRSEEMRRSGAGPSMSMAARLGGGLFAVMLTGLPGGPEAKAAVRLLLDRLSGRYFAGDEEIVLSMSVGIALAPADGLTAESLLQKAELAAHEALESGGAIRFYRQSSHRLTERSRAITRLLPNALARGELRLHYQPLVDGLRVARPRRRGAPPLGVPGARRGSAVGVRPPRRGGGPDGGHRELGPADGLPAGRILAGRRGCRAAGSRSTCRCASSCAATSPRSCARAWRRPASRRHCSSSS